MIHLLYDHFPPYLPNPIRRFGSSSLVNGVRSFRFALANPAASGAKVPAVARSLVLMLHLEIIVYNLRGVCSESDNPSASLYEIKNALPVL